MDKQRTLVEMMDDAEYRKKNSQTARDVLALIKQFESIQRERDELEEQKEELLCASFRLKEELNSVQRERDTYRQEAMNERELSESIVGEREQLLIEVESLQRDKAALIEEKESLNKRITRLEQVNVNCRVLAEDLTLEKEALIEVLEWIRDAKIGSSAESPEGLAFFMQQHARTILSKMKGETK